MILVYEKIGGLETFKLRISYASVRVQYVQ